MAYPTSAPAVMPPQAAPQASPPQGFDMGSFDQQLAELQSMLADLDGDGIPDAEQGRGPSANPTPQIPADARSEQDYSDQFGTQPPQPRAPAPRGPAPAVADVQALGQEAKARIASGEPRDSVIQDLFLRVTRQRASAGGPQVAEGPQQGTMSDAPAPYAPMPPMPRGRGAPRFGDLPMPEDGGNDAMVMTRQPGDVPPEAGRAATLTNRSRNYGGVLDHMIDEGELEEPENYPPMPGEMPPEAPEEPWQWRGVRGLASDAYDTVTGAPGAAYDYVADMEAPDWEDASAALEGVGELGMAAQATGGPPGAVVGGLMRAVGNIPATANAVGNRLLAGVGHMFPEGRAYNAAEDVARKAIDTSERYARVSGQPPPVTPQEVFGNSFSPFSRGNQLRATDTGRVQGEANRLTQRAEDAVTNYMTAPSRETPALPAPQAGQPNRLVVPEAQPGMNPAAFDRAGGAARAERDAEFARDALRGTSRSNRQQAVDEGLDDFMQTLSQVPRDYQSSIPRLIKQHADETGSSLPEVVSALERRGYRIDADSVPQHAFQSRTPDGRFNKLDPEWKELLSIIRERAGRY